MVPEAESERLQSAHIAILDGFTFYPLRPYLQIRRSSRKFDISTSLNTAFPIVNHRMIHVHCSDWLIVPVP